MACEDPAGEPEVRYTPTREFAAEQPAEWSDDGGSAEPWARSGLHIHNAILNRAETDDEDGL